MPIHDWTRVSAGTWHAFHVAWISELQEALNDGRMPKDYYALAEQITGPFGPDVLTLQNPNKDSDSNPGEQGVGVALATAPPRVRVTAEGEFADYAAKRRTLVIRHSSGDRIVALLEVVSPGNKQGQLAFQSFVEKAVATIQQRCSLFLVDLFPPTSRDPQGLHAAIWSEFSVVPFQPPPDEPLTLASYSAGDVPRAYVEPTAVRRTLIDMPLFLTADYYVNVPLESTYQAAYKGFPQRWRDVLEGKRDR